MNQANNTVEAMTDLIVWALPPFFFFFLLLFVQEYSLYTEAKDEVALEGEQSKCGFTSVCVCVCAQLRGRHSPQSCRHGHVQRR